MPAVQRAADAEADRRTSPRTSSRRRKRLILLPAGFPRDVEALACDLDRTLIGEDAVLRPRTSAAIARGARGRASTCHRHRADVPVGAAVRSTRPGIDDPVVCYQGAVVADPVSGRFLRHVPIPLELAREAIEAVEAEGYPLNCYVDDELYVARAHRRSPSATRSSSTSRCTRSATCSPGSTSRRRSSSRRRPGRARRSRGAAAGEHFGGRMYISKSLPYFLEFASPDVTKASGLAFVAEHLGFARSETVAFGDGENDVELLEWAGYAVAVENAHDRVLAIADFVCPSVDEEGVAQVIEAYLDSRAMIDLERRAQRSRGVPRPRSRARAPAEPFDALLAGGRALARARAAGRRAPRPPEAERQADAGAAGGAEPVKEELRAAEEELAAAEAERDRLLERCRTRRTESRRTATTEDDAEELRRCGRPPRSAAERHLRSARSTWSGPPALRLALRLPGSATRPRSPSRSTASRSTALAAKGSSPLLPPVLVREEAMYGTGFFPTEGRTSTRVEADELYLTGTSRSRSPACTWARSSTGRCRSATRVLDLLPPRGGRCGQGHARHVSRPPVQQGRACSPSRPEHSGDEHDRLLAIEEETRARPRPPLPRRQRRRPATSALQPRRPTTSRSGSRASAATARSRRSRTRRTSRPDACRSASAATARPEPVHMLNGNGDRRPDGPGSSGELPGRAGLGCRAVDPPGVRRSRSRRRRRSFR